MQIAAPSGIGGYIQGVLVTTSRPPTAPIQLIAVMQLRYWLRGLTMLGPSRPAILFRWLRLLPLSAGWFRAALLATEPWQSLPNRRRPGRLMLKSAPGTTAITAGTVTVTYVANDGTTQTDVVSAVIALSTAETVALSNVSIRLRRLPVGWCYGGTSPDPLALPQLWACLWLPALLTSPFSANGMQGPRWLSGLCPPPFSGRLRL